VYTERYDMPRKTTAQRAAATLGRLGGSAGTEAQNLARKRNAQLAGRPRRVCNHCGEAVIGGHTDKALDVSCGQHGWHWQKRVDKPSGT
jgi:hypothetical protein